MEWAGRRGRHDAQASIAPGRGLPPPSDAVFAGLRDRHPDYDNKSARARKRVRKRARAAAASHPHVAAALGLGGGQSTGPGRGRGSSLVGSSPAAMAPYRCVGCHRQLARSDFSIDMRRAPVDVRRCSKCVRATSGGAVSGTTYSCSVCRRAFPSTGFSKAQLKFDRAHRRCLGCVANWASRKAEAARTSGSVLGAPSKTSPRTYFCVVCQDVLPSTQFSNHQIKSFGDDRRRCRKCIAVMERPAERHGSSLVSSIANRLSAKEQVAVYAFEAAHDAVPGAVQEYVPQAVAEILRPLTEGLRRVTDSSGGVVSSDDSGGELRGHVSQFINMLDTCGTSSSSSVLPASDSTLNREGGVAVGAAGSASSVIDAVGAPGDELYLSLLPKTDLASSRPSGGDTIRNSDSPTCPDGGVRGDLSTSSPVAAPNSTLHDSTVSRPSSLGPGSSASMDIRKFNRWLGYNRRFLYVDCHKAEGTSTRAEQEQHREMLAAVTISSHHLRTLVHRGPRMAPDDRVREVAFATLRTRHAHRMFMVFHLELFELWVVPEDKVDLRREDKLDKPLPVWESVPQPTTAAAVTDAVGTPGDDLYLSLLSTSSRDMASSRPSGGVTRRNGDSATVPDDSVRGDSSSSSLVLGKLSSETGAAMDDLCACQQEEEAALWRLVDKAPGHSRV